MRHMTIRRLLASLVLFISVLLSAHALAFDIGGVSYDVINTTEIVVTGRASGNTDMDIVIPATVSDSGTIYVVRTIGAYAFPNNALTVWLFQAALRRLRVMLSYATASRA